jgi:hypothetical protein
MAIHISIDGDDADVLGVLRCEAILDALVGVAKSEIELSYTLAVTGAMRWPRLMRPEVLVAATCGTL